MSRGVESAADGATVSAMTQGIAAQPDPTPRFSASHMKVAEACPASYAREIEMAFFCQTHGIGGPDTVSPVADRGVKLRAVLSAVPYTGPGMGPERSDFWQTVYRVADANNVVFAAGDRCFVRECIARRDALIDALVERVRSDHGGVGRIELVADTQCYYLDVPLPNGGLEWFEGRPDCVAVVFDREGVARRALVADYKSSFAYHGVEANNVQLRTLAVLVAHKFPTVASVQVSLLARTDLAEGEVTEHTYALPELTTKLDRLMETVARGVMLADEFFATGEAVTNPEHEARMTDAGKVGIHCLECKGAVCCASLHSFLRESADAIEADRPGWEALLARLTPPKAKKGKDTSNQTPETEPMTPELLATRSAEIERFRLALDLMKKVNDAKNVVIRQMTAAGHKVPGFGVRPGAANIEIAEENDKPLSLREAFDRLVAADLVPADSFETALLTAGQFNASALRDFIAEENGVAPAAAMLLLKERLGSRSPVVMTTKAGIVDRLADVASPQAQPQVAEEPKSAASAMKRR